MPDAVFQLANLEHLYLAYNQLGVLPNAINQLTNLQRLSLDNNQLSTLPDGISRLVNLQSLSLDNNRLSTLPNAITRLTNLQNLSLANNQLSTLPDVITRLDNLRIIYVSGNPLLNPPLEVAQQGMTAIRAYFAQFGEADHLYEAKLLLVGEGAVGKSSLKKALTVPGFALSKAEKSTEGIDIQRWDIPKAALGLERDFRLNVWDFGGQEIYHATHQFFLTRRSIYLLVTESRREDQREDFYYWLNIIRLLGDRSPVILVLNKIDERRKDLPFNQLQHSFDNLVYYQEVSCAPGFEYTIDGLKQTICRALGDAQRMNHVRAPLPAVWVAIRDEVEQWRASGRNHLRNDEFLALCQGHGLDETVANVLSDYFHDLGIFLHFRDEVALADTIFLNHAWVTDAVYKVLDNPAVKARYGEFHDREMLDIWQDASYRGMAPQLLALMEKFEVCYRLPPTGYWAPQLLPEDEPAPIEWRGEQNNLRFEYRYTFMPKGMVSRFIVRRHQEIYERTQWRHGVLLAWGNSRALVKEDLYTKKITVKVEGGDPRGFLATTRHEFEAIHATFNRLEVQEKIPCDCPVCEDTADPYFFDYALLCSRLESGKRTADCERKPHHEVNIQRLVDAVILPEPDEDEFGDKRRHGVYIKGDVGRLTITEGGANVEGNVDTNGGDFMGRDQSSGDHIETHIGDNAQNIAAGKNVRQTVTTAPRNKRAGRSTNNAWINGTFYLLAAVVILALIGYLSNQISLYALPIVLIGGLLVVGVVGALQLRNDELLSEKGFLALMVETYKRLPLLKK